MSDVKATKIIRNKVADFYNISKTSTPDWRLLGYGVNSLNETTGAQMEEKTYIHEVTASSTVKGYKSSFSFDFDLATGGQGKWDTAAVEDIAEIGESHKTGTDAEREYVRVKWYKSAVTGSTRYFEARKFNVSVEVSNVNGAGGEQMVVTGNLQCIGDPTIGYWDTVDKKFYEGTPAMGALTVASAAGTTVGTTKITVAETLTSGNSYVYVTAATVTAPTLGADCSTGFTAWDGINDIAAVTGNQICIVEVDSNKLAVKAGIATVTSKAPTLGTLTVTSVAGTNTGDTKITVTETLGAGNSYVYKTATTVTLPIYGDTCTTGYTAWNGTADITATTSDEIMIVEIDSNSKAIKAGKATVTSK